MQDCFRSGFPEGKQGARFYEPVHIAYAGTAKKRTAALVRYGRYSMYSGCFLRQDAVLGVCKKYQSEPDEAEGNQTASIKGFLKDRDAQYQADGR